LRSQRGISLLDNPQFSFVSTFVPSLVLRNSNICLATHFSCFCNWMRLIVDVRTIGSCLPDFPRAVSSAGVRKKSQVATPLRPPFATIDVAGGVVFFAVLAASSVVRLFRIRTSVNSSTLLLGCPVWALAFRTTFNSSNVTVHVPYRS
jgi:hypothetical protein